MNRFFDLHNHMLFGVDDGASDEEQMYAMLEQSYRDGVRAMCLTPHFSPYLYGDTSQKSAHSFSILREYAANHYPDMELFLGHELGYYSGCMEALRSGACRSLAGSRYVLVDFPETVDFFEITSAVDLLQGNGYVPVIAHAERYACLSGKDKWLEMFVLLGGVIQLNASSAIGGWGRRAQKQWTHMVKKGFAHVISSDGHDTVNRPPLMSVCKKLLEKYCSEDALECLMWTNAWNIVHDLPVYH